MPAARVIIRRYFPNCGLATTGHDSETDGRYPTTIGSKGMGAMHRKKITGGRVVDVTQDEETGQIVPKGPDGTVTDFGGSTVVGGSLYNRDSEWPLSTYAPSQDVGIGNQNEPIARMPKSHVSKHSIGTNPQSLTSPPNTGYSYGIYDGGSGGGGGGGGASGNHRGG